MSKRFFMSTAVIVFVSCSMYYFGCSGKKYDDLNARPSTKWVKNAVIDEVSLRSFSKAGTFKSLEVQIPGIKKLGVSVVSLMPIHPIGELNRRGKLGSLYAVKDFYTVNPEFGTLEDFKLLVNSIHQQGLKIIINLVINQAAWDSQLLMEHPDWFVHNEEGAIVAPNSEWSDVAQLDYRQHELRKYMIAMMVYWVKEIDIDGFQCYASELIPTDFWDVARNELDKIKSVLMISEGGLPEHHIKAFDITCSWNMNNALANVIDGMASASIINDSLSAEFHQFPKGSLHLRFNIKDNKYIEDSSFIEKSHPPKTKIIAVLAFTLPGVPLINTVNEAGNKNQLNSLNKLFEDLNTFHRNHSALQNGSYWNMQNSANSYLFSFIRISGKDSVLVIVNFANEKKEADIQLPAGASIIWKDQFSGTSIKVKNTRLSVAIMPLGFLVLVPSSEKGML